MDEPRGYAGPHAHDRQPGQVMADGAAQNLIAEIVSLHEQLCAQLDHDVHLAAHPPTSHDSPTITGTTDHDQMAVRASAIRGAEADRDRQLKNARQDLRRVKESYEARLGRRPPRRPRVESIDYRNGNQRRVG